MQHTTTLGLSDDVTSTITRTLNDGHYAQTYGGLSKVDTTYPISAYITHLVYLKGTMVEVDVPAVTVSSSAF